MSEEYFPVIPILGGYGYDVLRSNTYFTLFPALHLEISDFFYFSKS